MVHHAPVFLSKRSVFNIFTHQIPLIGFGPGSWIIAATIGVLSCVIPRWNPIMLFRKHKGIMLNKVR